jgi:hypothetical protein
MAKARKKQARSQRVLAQRLGAYGVAATAALVTANRASAEVVHSGLQRISFGQGGPIEIDLDGDGTNDFRFRADQTTNVTNSTTSSSGSSSYTTLYGGNQQQALMAVPLGGNFIATTSGSSHAADVPNGSFIGNAGTNSPFTNYAANSQVVLASFLRTFVSTTTDAPPFGNADSQFGNFDSGSGLLGVQFDIDGEDHFGWIRFESGSDYGASGTIVEWAFENVAGAGLNAGQTTGGTPAVPEPGTIGLMGLGALALGVSAARRRREQQRATKPAG